MTSSLVEIGNSIIWVYDLCGEMSEWLKGLGHIRRVRTLTQLRE
jgi:hypothetical protein